MGFSYVGVIVLIISLGVFKSFVDQPDNLHIVESKFNFKMKKNLSAFVLGGTGATGKGIIEALAASPQFTRVTLIGRRQVTLPSPDKDSRYDKFDEKIVDFEKLDEYKDAFKGYDVGFSSLGTTKAKSGPEGYQKVDHDYVVNSAKLAKEGGVKHFHLVTVRGADKDGYFSYSKVKGQAEHDVGLLGFQRLSIYRPGLLLTEREDARMLEKVFQCIFKPLDLLRWFSVETTVLGKVMVANSFREDKEKIEVINHGEIITLSKLIQNNPK